MAAFRSLRVWQHVQQLAIECGKAAKRFPPDDRGILADQLKRAAFSVPLNIAEGSSRKGSKEFRRFLAEVQTALDISKEMGYLAEADFERLNSMADETAKILWGLLRKLSGASIRDAVS